MVLGNDYRKWLSIVSVNTILENSLQGSNTADEQMATVDGSLIKQDWKLLVASLKLPVWMFTQNHALWKGFGSSLF